MKKTKQMSLVVIAELITRVLGECERKQRSGEVRPQSHQKFENAHARKYGNGIALFLTGLPGREELLRKKEAVEYLEWLNAGNTGFPDEMRRKR